MIDVIGIGCNGINIVDVKVNEEQNFDDLIVGFFKAIQDLSWFNFASSVKKSFIVRFVGFIGNFLKIGLLIYR